MLGRLLAIVLLLLVSTFGAVSPAPAEDGTFFALGGDTLELGMSMPAGTVSTGAEPQMFVDRVTGALLVGDTSGIHRSTNSGVSWTHPVEPFLFGLFTDGRSLAQDANGKLYAATTQGQTIGVATSTNGGATWTIASHLAAAASIADRPWLAARGNGQLALLYFGDAQEMCTTSTDGGLTWTPTGVLETPNAGNAVFDNTGRLWYADGSGVTYYPTPCSTLGAQTFALPASGAQIFTQVAIDKTKTPPHQFVAQPSTSNGQMLLRGHGSMGFSAPWKDVVVSPSTVKSNTFGTIAIKDDGSEIAVAWYGSSTAGDPSAGTFPTTASWNVYVSRVTNFWSATPTVTTTTVATGNHVGQFCMGGVSCTTQDRDLLDYMGLTYSSAGRLHVAWGHDGSSATSSVRYANLG
jgi:hypothetical protein